VAFVIDVSGSMATRGTGKSKIQRAKDNLTSVLKSFRRDVRFNIISFHSTVRSFKNELVPAGKAQKGEALTWVGKLRATGATNIYDALVLALDLKDVDSVFLLSDGAPSAGEVVDMDEILRRITSMNRFRRVRINTIGIGVSGRTAKFMQDLAQENFGESRIGK
jgi:Mg-chelatase subunit ChlD